MRHHVGSSCDTGAVARAGPRNGCGPEPNQPNTINDSCADGTSGTFHSDECNDRLKVSTTDGTQLRARQDRAHRRHRLGLDDAVGRTRPTSTSRPTRRSPTWTFIGTLIPTAAGAQTLSATYTLPAGALQAVRVQFRYQSTTPPARRAPSTTATTWSSP